MVETESLCPQCTSFVEGVEVSWLLIYGLSHLIRVSPYGLQRYFPTLGQNFYLDTP